MSPDTAGTEAADSTRRVTRAVWLAAAGTTVAFAVAHLSDTPSIQVLFDNIHWTVADLSAAWLAWLGYRCGNPVDRSARRWFVLGLGSYATGQLIWNAQVYFEWQPFPAPSDLFYSACGPLIAIGIWQSLRRRSSVQRANALVLDSAILLIQFMALILVFYLPRRPDVPLLPLLQLSVYPVAMFGGALMAMILAVTLRLRWHWRWLLLPLGLLLQGLTWMRWNLLDLSGTPANGTWLNFSFSVASLLVGVGAACWNAGAEKPGEAKHALSGFFVLMPVIMVITAMATAFLVWVDDDLPRLGRAVILLAAATVIGLSVVRQGLWLAERERLLRIERRLLEHEQRHRVLAQRLELAVSSGRLGIWDVDLTRRHAIWDQRMYELYGLDPQAEPDPYDAWEQTVHPDDLRKVRGAIVNAATTHTEMSVEFRIIRPAGELRHLEALGKAQYDDQGRPVRMIGINRDVTERVMARRVLAESEAELSAIFENSVIGIALIDKDRRVLRSNRAVREFLGYKASEVAGINAESIVHPDEDDASRRQFAALLAGGADSYQAERRYRRSDGTFRWVRVTVYPVELRSDRCFVVMIEDVQERKQMELNLLDAQDKELRMREEFAFNLLQVQEQERQRIANELHDSLGQILSVIKNRAQLAMEHTERDSAIASQLQGILQVAVQAIDEVRSMAHDLRPLHIEQLGLTAALTQLLGQFQQTHRIQLQSRVENIDDAFQHGQVTHIYRLVQESLNNIDKHAAASEVRVLVERDLHAVRIVIEDNGTGFDVDAPGGSGLGLTSITERTHMLGGQVRIDSRIAGGTRISIDLPIHESVEPLPGR